jgi:hypothetical protein
MREGIATRLGSLLLLVVSATMCGFGIGALVLNLLTPAPAPMTTDAQAVTTSVPAVAIVPQPRIWPPLFGLETSDPEPAVVVLSDEPELSDPVSVQIRLIGVLLGGSHRRAFVEIAGQTFVLSEGAALVDGITLSAIRWGQIVVHTPEGFLEIEIHEETDQPRAVTRPSILALGDPSGRYPGFEAVVSD